MNPKSPTSPPTSNPYQQPRQAAGPAGQMRRRPQFWLAIGLVWLATFSCTSVLASGDQDGSTTDTAAKRKPAPTATTTVTATATATTEPEPAPTVTETKKVTVHVTKTVRSGGGGDGGAAADTNSGSGHHGLPAGPPPGPDVDCSDLSGPVWVGNSDPHRLDRDGDGIGCDS